MAAGNGFLSTSPDARYGDTESGFASQCFAQKFTTPDLGNLDINEIGVYGYQSGGAIHLAIFTHDAANDCPETIVANSDSGQLTLGASMAKVSYSYGTKPQLSGNTIYWIVCVVNSTGAGISRFDAGASPVYMDVTYPNFPSGDTWHGHYDFSRDLSLYAVYETQGGTSIVKVINETMGIVEGAVNKTQGLIVKVINDAIRIAEDAISVTGDAYTVYYDCEDWSWLTYDAMNTALANLCTANPSWTPVTFGQSAESRDIKGIIIHGLSYNHTIFLNSGLHGNEVRAQRALLDWLNYLSANPSLYQYTRFIVAPIVNPDGQVRSQGKNHNSAVEPLREVNLNRNFDPGWDEGDGSTDPASPVYKGPYVESEPESQLLMSIITTYKPNTHFDVHSPDLCIYTESGVSLDMYNLVNGAVQADGFASFTSNVIAQDGMLFNYSRSQGADSYIYETSDVNTAAEQRRESNKLISALRAVSDNADPMLEMRTRHVIMCG